MPLLNYFLRRDMKVGNLVYDAIKPLFKGDIQLLEVEYVKKNDGMHLCVYIDKKDGVKIDDCVAVNNMIESTIDDLNPTNDEPYFLDVSSYGLDKPLKYDWQFKKYENQKVNVKLYKKINGKKDFVATLKSKDENSVVFALDDENITINLADIAYITPYIEF